MAEETKPKDNKTIEVELPELTRPLEKMTVKELREIGLKIPTMVGVHAMKKDELVARFREIYGIKEEVKATVEGIGQVKAKIRSLKVKKVQAQRAEGKAKVDVDVIRKRISRLKKKTRKLAKAAKAAA